MTSLGYRTDTSAAEALAPHLPALRAALEEQRGFRTEQLAEVTGVGPEGGAAPVDDARFEITDAVRVGARAALKEIDHALERMSEGSYGSCEGCKGPIPFERLEMLLTARHCIRCQQARETRR